MQVPPIGSFSTLVMSYFVIFSCLYLLIKKTCLPPLVVSVSSCITFSQIKDYLFLLFVCFLRLPAEREGNYIGIPTVTYTLLMTSRSGMDESAITVALNTTMDLIADLRRIQDKPPLNHLVLI